jgi:2-oxoisovalerate dehydrogenase E1 component
MGKSIEKVRLQCKPLFHLVDTYRLMAHSKGDDTRSDETVASFRNKDPLNILFEECGEKDWLREMVSEIRRRIDLAIEKAESAAFLDLQPFRDNKLNYTWEEKSLKRQRINSSINEGLHEVLAANNKIHIIGEDIESPYGGAFKVTAGLSAEFPNRVRNTPLSEGAIVGIGNGLALGGYIPVVEIMFGDFITLAADQWINHASKFKGMYNNQVKIPLVIRTPMGGKRGYGPTHSQSIEKLFLGYPDTQVICLHHRYCPALLYKSLFNTIDRPTLVVENKILYTQFVDPDPPSGYQLLHSKTTYPVTWLKPGEKPELTILAIGGMSIDAENAMQQLFEQDEIIAELFLPTLLYPFDTTFLIDSLVQTKKLLIIEEGQSFASLSAEIIAQLAERPDVAGTQFRRVASLSSPIPSSRPLEEKCLPSVTSIIKKALEMMHV